MITGTFHFYKFNTLITVTILTLFTNFVSAAALNASVNNPRHINQNASTYTLLVIGDSLSAGYGLANDEGWVSILKQRLALHSKVEVINASISGETTLGGLNRLAKLIDQHTPSSVIIELGGNDGLRGLPIPHMRDNLRRMITELKKRNILILLVGMKLPPNYGKNYTQDFHNVYIQLAKEYSIPLVPFMLEGVANNWEMMQADGIHPRAQAQSQILDTMWPFIRPLLPKIDP